VFFVRKQDRDIIHVVTILGLLLSLFSLGLKFSFFLFIYLFITIALWLQTTLLTKKKCISFFSVTFVWSRFRSDRYSTHYLQDAHRNAIHFHVEIFVILFHINQNLNLLKIVKNFLNIKSHKNPFSAFRFLICGKIL
jgi:hypothetical protein